MSIVLAVKVSEGIVLASDSASTLTGTITGPQGALQGVLKTYYNARKLLQLGDFPIGVLTWGQAFVGLRTIESLVREWEYNEKWQSTAEYKTKYTEPYKVKESAQRLLKHITAVYNSEYGTLSDEKKPILGMLVAGYSEQAFFPEIWSFVLPMNLDGQVQNTRPDVDGKPDFGANWFGMTDSIIRLHWGRDDAVMKIISEKFGVPEKEVSDALQPLQYQIPFAVMPLQDAIDYAYYMVNVVIGRFRFVIGSDLCGGEIEIAAITQGKFNWISRKVWKL
ncbi:MAG TPA: hypothetical protein VEI46_08665 [Thermodesulfovibrionales bacterium]|nr:hypothetical protein [Thermodesulfovibrionales bacterium]